PRGTSGGGSACATPVTGGPAGGRRAGTLRVTLAKGRKVVARSGSRTLKLSKRLKPGAYTLTVTYGSAKRALRVTFSR
ncbi:hypothetical protein OJ997_35700, partial [Solirubrobacter phytolaccae]